MLSDRKQRPQPPISTDPSHTPSHPGTKGSTKTSDRDVCHPAQPQPQQNTTYPQSTHAYPQQPHPQASTQVPPQPQRSQQQQRAPSVHPRRGSTDRGTSKDSSRARATTPKGSMEQVGPYLLGKTLGKGSSGCVKLARHRKTNEQVAVKIISKASLANRAAVHRGIEREIAIMKLINHPHVIRLYDVYETEKELFLVMEYVSGGELFEYLVNKGRLDEGEALRFFQQIIVGLAFCHKRKICHRDLKPENLLLDDRMNVKIADFGMASLQTTGRLLETSCGSPHYASPEVVTGLKYDGSSSDIWSCGIILYALLTGHLPFDDENIRQLLSKVKAGKFYMPTDISPGARDLISRMLTVSPKRRITMQGVMMHPWFRMVNPERNTLGNPAEDPESGRPLQVEELDGEILRHMRWLFAPGPSHSDPDSKEVYDEKALLFEIQEKMTSNEDNMEKLFYRLLCQHKTELLENYIGDDNDSIPDGPRRRADSFPNSVTSMRSATPDFSRITPLTTPGSPLSPSVRGIQSAEPSPLTLNHLNESDVAAATTETNNPKGIKINSRTPSPTLEQQDASTKAGATTTKTASRNGAKIAEPITTMVEADSSNPATKAVAAAATLPAAPCAEKKLSAELKANTAPTQSSVVQEAWRSVPAESTHSGNDDLPPTSTDHSTKDAEKVSTTSPSIEHQVLSTAISEDNRIVGPTEESTTLAAAEQSPPVLLESVVATTTLNQISESSVANGIEKSRNSIDLSNTKAIGNPAAAPAAVGGATGSRPHRPLLHPLDVKASAGMTAMSVSVSQHSRKCSDGTPGVHPSSTVSPTGPKRPWFARLFDFKPQPLTFRSQWGAAETQDRLEGLLKEIFDSSIQIESFKKPPYGFKCRYEGGVMGDQAAKAVKFKIDITEKSGSIAPSSPNSASQSVHGTATVNHMVSSSAVAAILATVELHHQHYHQHHHHFGNHSQNQLCSASADATAMAASNAGRRASDGGSILSSAAAAVSTSLAAAASRSPFGTISHHHHHHHHKHNQFPLHYHSHHMTHGPANGVPSTSSPPSASAAAFPPPLPLPLALQTPQFSTHHSRDSSSTTATTPTTVTGSWRSVKVTLHQQQGANSTLRMIHEKLVAAWDYMQQQQQQQMGSVEFNYITTPPPTMQKAPRAAAM